MFTSPYEFGLFEGLLPLWRFTVQGHYQLQVTMQDWDGTSVYAMYDHFKIGSPGEKYTLQAHAFSGTAGRIRTFAMYEYNNYI